MSKKDLLNAITNMKTRIQPHVSAQNYTYLTTPFAGTDKRKICCNQGITVDTTAINEYFTATNNDQTEWDLFMTELDAYVAILDTQTHTLARYTFASDLSSNHATYRGIYSGGANYNDLGAKTSNLSESVTLLLKLYS